MFYLFDNGSINAKDGVVFLSLPQIWVLELTRGRGNKLTRGRVDKGTREEDNMYNKKRSYGEE